MSTKLSEFAGAQWRKSTLRRFILWFFAWKRFRKALFAGAVVVTLFALLIVEENWRGKRAWNRYAEQARAKGIALTLEEIAPPPVPDRENFVATPVWKELRYDPSRPFTGEFDTNRWPPNASRALQAISKVRPETGTSKRARHAFDWIDLPALAAAFDQLGNPTITPVTNLPPALDPTARSQAAAEILEQLKPYESVFEELRQALPRPEARFPVRYDTPNPITILLPHLSVLKGFCQTLRLKVAAELAAGHPEQAMEDVRLMLRLSDSLKDEPVLISYLVRLAMVHLTLNAIWEGTAFQSWTAPQLEELQAAMRQFDLVADARLALTGERVFGNGAIDYLRRARGRAVEADGMMDNGDGPPADLLVGLMPTGWLFLEKLNCNRFFDAYIDFSPRSGDPRIDPGAFDERDARLSAVIEETGVGGHFLRHRMLATLFLPALTNSAKKGAKGQAFVEMGMLACALERHRLARGTYPDRLGELVPDFLAALPNDIVATEPYGYRHTDGASFLLYSVGWNQTDDGGVGRVDGEELDWVWRERPMQP